jgi:hypothetical protein
MFRLTMDVHQQLADLAQQRQGDGAAVDAGQAAALAPDLARQDHPVRLIRQPFPLQDRRDAASGLARQGKLRLDDRRFGALAHDAHIGAAAQDELDGVDDDRLAGAGLAGEDNEASGKRELELGNDGEIAYAEGLEHLSSRNRVS